MTAKLTQRKADTMSSNSILNNAKYSADTDEWYTTYETIAEELAHYEGKFKGKIVLCNSVINTCLLLTSCAAGIMRYHEYQGAFPPYHIYIKSLNKKSKINRAITTTTGAFSSLRLKRKAVV